MLQPKERNVGVFEMEKYRGFVISAYPCCGKSYITKHGTKYKMTDSDSSKYSWIEEKQPNGEIKKVRNPHFLEDYLAHIKEALQEYDVVFVSSHLQVRQMLQDNDIPFITIYPKNERCVKLEWIGRMWERGSDEEFIKFQYEHWDEFVSNISNEPHGSDVFVLGSGDYITEQVIDLIRIALELSDN